MPVSQVDSPPSSPKSPPRKRPKFSLKRKKKTASDCDREKREKLFPIFTSPAQNASDDDSLEPLKPPLPYAGLKNHGNICYANAVLQVLRYCPGLLESVDKIDSLVREIWPAKEKSQHMETRGNEDVSWFSKQYYYFYLDRRRLFLYFITDMTYDSSRSCLIFWTTTPTLPSLLFCNAIIMCALCTLVIFGRGLV